MTAGRLGQRSGTLLAHLPDSRSLILVLAVGVLALLMVVPLGFLLFETFVDGGGLTLGTLREAYAAAGLGEMAANSAVFAGGAATLSVTLGTVLAYLTVRTDLPGRRMLFAIVLVPLIIPGILHTVAWIFLANPRIGIVNGLLGLLPGAPRFDIFSHAGMILVEGLRQVPLVFLLMAAAFRSMDPSLEESALMSGARLPTVLRRVTLPLVRPALFGAILISVVDALESFEVPALLGIPQGIWVFTSRIWRALDTLPADFGRAGAYATSLLVILAVLIYLHGRLSERGERFRTVTGRAYRPRLIALGRARWPALLFVVGYILLAVVLPLLILMYVSTQQFYSPPSLDSIAAATLDNYRYVLDHPQVTRAFRNSLVLSLGAATGVTVIAGVLAWMVVRTRWRGRWIVDNLASLPLALPGLVVGVALLYVYVRAPIGVYGTLWILLIAYLTRYMPYGMRYASAAMHQVGEELEESAWVSGATWWETFRRIYLPLVAPGLVAGWIYVVIVSVRELSSSILLYSPGSEVLSVVIWEQWENGQFAALSALGVVMIVVLLVVTGVAARLGARLGVREA